MVKIFIQLILFFFSPKVGDFGLSSLKNATYLTAKSGRGTVMMFSCFFFIFFAKCPFFSDEGVNATSFPSVLDFVAPTASVDGPWSPKKWTFKWEVSPNPIFKLLSSILAIKSLLSLMDWFMQNEELYTNWCHSLLFNRSDVFSFGVILWELVTASIPWNNLNSMQVIFFPNAHYILCTLSHAHSSSSIVKTIAFHL